MSQSKVTITDIAKSAGVSKTTVSRVLNDKPEVDSSTRERVLKTIKETGFVPQITAINLAKGNSNIIGLLVPTLTSPYSLTVVQGVAEKIAETDYELILYTTSLSEKNQERFIKKIAKKLIDGLVILLPRNFKNIQTQILKHKIPIVLIDHRGVDLDLSSISASNKKGAFDAVEYLIILKHKHIGFITGLMDFGCSQERLAGYREALQKNDINIDDSIIKFGDFTEASGYMCSKELLKQQNEVTALFCSNDEMAFGAIQAVKDLGLKIPDDISIIGFDDVPKAAYSFPPLTTVKQPLQAMGEKAAELVIQQIRASSFEKEDLFLDTQLIIRDTCSLRK